MTLPTLRTLTVVFGLLALLAGCSTPTNYVVVPEDEEEPTPAPPSAPAGPDRYTVKPGDSLYLISFATGTDWRDIARLNGISAPYRIYPGQSLLVRGRAPSSSAPPVAAVARPAPQSAPVSAIPLPSPAPGASSSAARAPTVATRPPAQPPRPAAAVPAPAPKSATATTAAAPASVAATGATPSKPSAAAPSSVRPPRPGAWQWPASGKVIEHFSGGAQPHKGIDLEGHSGDPVRAANSGVVVYAGSGVRGYGNLLIVKHDDVYLSAYAHNSTLLVKEGDVVKAGQTIAQIGDSGTDRVKLHFEVRRKGSPVDPAKILPRR